MEELFWNCPGKGWVLKLQLEKITRSPEGAAGKIKQIYRKNTTHAD